MSACEAQLDEALVCLALQQLCRAAAGGSGAGRTERGLLSLVARVLELRTALVPPQLAHVLRCAGAIECFREGPSARRQRIIQPLHGSGWDGVHALATGVWLFLGWLVSRIEGLLCHFDTTIRAFRCHAMIA